MTIVSYSSYLNRMGALAGIPVASSTPFLTAWNSHFDSAIKRAWTLSNWISLCPYGEARFVGNSLEYASDLSNTTYWTATDVTVTKNAIKNPLDGRTTASKVLETAANSTHVVTQSFTNFTPSTMYTVTAYIRGLGRQFAYLTVTDGGGETYTVFFDLSGNGAIESSTANVTGTNIAQQPNGFYVCQFTFTSDTDAGASAGSYVVGASDDGTNTSYAGDTAKGLFVWGNNLTRVSNNDQSDFLLPYDQTGEQFIDTVLDAWTTTPVGVAYPPEQPYELTPSGIQFIAANWNSYFVSGILQNQIYGSPPANPVFLYYRKKCPTFQGPDYSESATYDVDDQVYFTDSDDVSNFYKCIVDTAAGEDPEDTPASWELLEIPEFFFSYICYLAYGDWLISDGQQDKAAGSYQLAEREIQDAYDVEERQSGHIQKTTFSTHVSAMRRTY